MLISSFHSPLQRRAQVASYHEESVEDCHEALKGFAGHKIPHDNWGRALSLVFCSEMILPGLLCKTVTELRLQS